MPNLNTGILAAVPLVVPPANGLVAFAAAVDALHAWSVARDAEVDTLAQVRDALLPRLLSGEVRIPNVECIVGADT
jgi:type I restriction enzyme S subunit